ncbi:MAG: hypothetical protein WCX32_00440 [Clostridia bacterium]|jgi:hypothetical protein|nr:hypothetical protein [Clostridia bacterium]MDD4276034.1 hypothetical protein [Clostridia bacterium]
MISSKENLKLLEDKLLRLYDEQELVEKNLSKLSKKESAFGWYAQSIYGGSILLGTFSIFTSFITSGLMLIVTAISTLICASTRIYQNAIGKKVAQLEKQLSELKTEQSYTKYDYLKLKLSNHIKYRVQQRTTIHNPIIQHAKNITSNNDNGQER